MSWERITPGRQLSYHRCFKYPHAHWVPAPYAPGVHGLQICAQPARNFGAVKWGSADLEPGDRHPRCHRHALLTKRCGMWTHTTVIAPQDRRGSRGSPAHVMSRGKYRGQWGRRTFSVNKLALFSHAAGLVSAMEACALLCRA